MADKKRGETASSEAGYALLVILKLAGWLLLFAAGCLVGLAKPETTTFYDKIYQTTPRQEWNMELIRRVPALLTAGIACTPLGLVVYLTGIRSRKYGFPVSLVLTGLLAVAALVAYHAYT